jgi:hypothetical protein
MGESHPENLSITDTEKAILQSSITSDMALTEAEQEQDGMVGYIGWNIHWKQNPSDSPENTNLIEKVKKTILTPKQPVLSSPFAQVQFGLNQVMLLDEKAEQSAQTVAAKLSMKTGQNVEVLRHESTQ